MARAAVGCDWSMLVTWQKYLSLIGPYLLVIGHELSQSVNGDWEYYSGVVLSRNTVQCLQISQLKDTELKIEPLDLMFNNKELS